MKRWSGAIPPPPALRPSRVPPAPVLSGIVEFAASRLHVLSIVAALAFRVRSAEDIEDAGVCDLKI
jgi:hypothetical protein